MPTFLKKYAAGFAAAAAAAILTPSNIAIAQDVESIRAKCIDQAVSAYPGAPIEGAESRARVETYIVCMRQHGLTP